MNTKVTPPPASQSAKCRDCGMPYSEFPLDVVLPHDQWQTVNGSPNGLLCAACIVARGAKLPSVTVAKLHFPDLASQSASSDDSRSRLRRVAIEKGEPAPRFDQPLVDAETLRLHMGELTTEEVRVAQAAFRLGQVAATSGNSGLDVPVGSQGLNSGVASDGGEELPELLKKYETRAANWATTPGHYAAGHAKQAQEIVADLRRLATAGQLPDWNMARHWIDRYAADMDEEPQLDRIAEALGLPDPTPEQR